jgi:hypothetical protein
MKAKVTKKKKKPEGISLKDAMKANRWGIINIDDVPDDYPILAVERFASKSLAKFHLVKKVLVPITA